MVLKILFVILLLAGQAFGVTVYTSDFISTAQRTHFNSFESTSGSVQTTDMIRVAEINGDGIASWSPVDGSKAWYHTGGDNGYTSITMSDGSDFVKLGMYIYNGWSSTSNIYYNYQVRNNGSIIASGSLLATNMPSAGLSIAGYRYLGFDANGTPFDQVFLSATNGSSQAPTSGTYQALALDAIETAGTVSTPQPALSVSNTTFGNVRVGNSANASVTVTNAGASGSSLTGNIGAASGSEFSPTSGSQSFTLGQNQASTRTFTYTPSARGSDSTVISVTSNASNTTATLTGTGVSPVYSSIVAPGSTMDFGVVDKDVSTTRTLTIQNITPDADLGNLTNMTLLSASISGLDAAYYSIENFTPGTVLAKNGSTNLVIRITNNDYLVETRNAVLTIVTDVNAALGAAGNVYTYNLTAYLVPEPSSYVFFSMAILLGFLRLYRKK